MLKTETLAVQTVPKYKYVLGYESDLHNPEVLDAAPPAPLNDEDILMAEQVAKIVSGVSFIGHARRKLELAGHNAHIVANRITVNHEIVAQLIAGSSDEPRWTVYSVDGTPPVWIVGALS